MHKILIVEDNEMIRENLEELLLLYDFEAITAHNGRIGIEKMQAEKPDLIVCDIAMPEANGYEVLKKLKSIPEIAQTPFIFLTASAQKTDIEKGQLSQADYFMTKPFDIEELVKVINLLLEQ